MSMVDFRNVALGDQNLFLVEDNNLFVVADAAEGTQGIRRQRLGGVSETSIPTQLKIVRIYEELNRVLAGRVNFNYFIDKVAESFSKKLLDDIYTLWTGVTADQLGGVTYFPAAGSYDEDDLLDLMTQKYGVRCIVQYYPLYRYPLFRKKGLQRQLLYRL